MDANEPTRPRRGSRRKRIALGVLLGLAALVVVLNWTWGNLPDEPRRSGSEAQLGDVRVRYVERPGVRPEVLLLHGLPGTAEDFERVTPLLAGHRTIALDRPGFGFSDGGYHPLTEQLTAIEALLDQLAIRRVIVVGHSYGGTLALAFAARHPERVRGLVLVDAAAAGASTTGFERAQARLVQGLSLPVVQPLADVTFAQVMRKASAQMGAEEAFGPDPVDDAYERRLLAVTMQHDDLDAYAAETLVAGDVIEQTDEQLRRIEVPAVVIHGDRDRSVTPEHGRRLAAELPRARFVGVPGGHMVPLVHPDVVAEAVRSCAAGCGTH
ncbi:alpha/beta fold hydrolase [Conexibacter woesei]|uniref:Alpha/beta hydrolase fold protein n=1 Tax=Conexibacter woesei (strain DSM 14684 / CCUG 47730 / CIP 108061 / JCM 11494 / NBRC 100937 / ID131577) TaxID=469383 RepID=D3F1Q3_CONWI|nr:alpha/beta hydrolase [Conexibacter woesei]ADB54084.1 alpha/beta hydrolase fold protein [Conexibacter woesei DSM 14684]